MIVKTLEQTPPDATHSSTRSLAAASGLTKSTVSRIWRAFGLKPLQTDNFKLSPDPLFIDKVHDIVGLFVWHMTAEDILDRLAAYCERINDSRH